MRNILRKFIYRFDLLLFIFVKLKSLFVDPRSQSNETVIIDQLINKYKISKNYLEIGFSPWEYNCSKISSSSEGIIVDANTVNIKIGKWLIKKANFICEFIDLENIENVIKKIKLDISVLSLDIDGNDYHIMERLFKLNPSLIICEYNPAFHLRPITTPYKKDFDRTKTHKTWLYYGCSLKAWEIIMKKNDYSMVAVSESGVNAFFIKDSLIKEEDKIIILEKEFVDYKWPNEQTHADMWDKIKDMEYKIIN